MNRCFRSNKLFILPPSSFILAFGEVQEWLNWQHWKCCERGTVPWVRIPPSPPETFPILNCRFPIGSRVAAVTNNWR